MSQNQIMNTTKMMSPNKSHTRAKKMMWIMKEKQTIVANLKVTIKEICDIIHLL